VPNLKESLTGNCEAFLVYTLFLDNIIPYQNSKSSEGTA